MDLTAERAHGAFLRANSAFLHAATDLSDGGLALAAFEMAEASNLGLTLDSGDTPEVFGEDQARYLVACGFDQAEALMSAASAAGVPLTHVGRFGGDQVTIGSSSAPLADLSATYRTAFEDTVG